MSATDEAPDCSTRDQAWADLLIRGAADLGIELSDRSVERLWQYTTELRRWSQRVNLVGSTDLEVIARLHLLDSLAGVRFLPRDAKSCADVGTGAGLPGMVAALVDARVQWALIDSSRKRCQFIEHVRSALEVGNVSVRCARAEEVGRDPAMREAYDAAVCRAVGSLEVVAEYCLPLVRVGGQFIALKGPAVEAELAGAAPAVDVLGGQVREVAAYRLPGGEEERRAVVVDKIRATPQRFPRRPGVAAKRARRVDRHQSGV